MDERLSTLSTELEYRLYVKHLNRGELKTYKDDIRTMLSYMRKDSSGNVLSNLINGLFPLNEAIQLRLVDWVDRKTN